MQSNSQEIRSTVSDSNGVFYFTPIIPGPYTIKVSRDRWHFKQSVRTVNVKTGNTELPNDFFVVSGFDVHGQLLNAGQAQSTIGIGLYTHKTVRFKLLAKRFVIFIIFFPANVIATM